MSFSFRFGWSHKEQQGLTKQRSTPPILVILPLNPMLAVIQKEAKNLMPPGQAPRGGSIWPLANTHSGEAPKEAIDISAIRDIDLMQGGEYVLL